MTTEYHDEPEDDSSSFWNKEPRPVYLSGVSRFRSWLFPALTASAILIIIIALGASKVNSNHNITENALDLTAQIQTSSEHSSGLSSRLGSVEKSVSNLSESLNVVQQLSTDTSKEVHRLKFAVEVNKDQLTSVADALKQLSDLDSLSRTVTSLKCSLERLIRNGSVSEGCCPLNWESFGTSCYLFSKTPMAWHNARDSCNGQESHLAILITDEEWNFVTEHGRGSFYWIGLTDERTGRWEWVNQTPYVMNRRHWMPGQPDAWIHHNLGPGDEDCAHLHHDGRLNDLHCSSKLRFICQKHSARS